MPATSHLVALYEAIYGKAPSSHSTVALLRMEHVLGLTQDDALGRMMVVLLHVADRLDDAVGKRTADERTFVKNFQGFVRETTFLTQELQKSRDSVAGTVRRTSRQLSDDQVIGVYATASPLFTYLGHAFRRRIGPLEADERIVAARGDLFGITVLMAGIILITMALGSIIG
jgi:hypothetical protein